MSNNSKTETIPTDSKPLITIVGVLGKQGLSAAHSLLESGGYRVRGITRRINSQEAVSLAAKGVELINIPLDLGHYNEYVSAFHGSDGVFLMTPQIAPPATHEYELGKELADAAVEAGVRHVIFSSLENIDKISAGKLFAPHFTDKARIEEYIRTLPITSSFIYMAFFFTNLIEYYTPYQDNDTLVFPIYLPKNFKAPFVDPLTATGPAVLEIFSNPDVYSGKAMPVIGEIISPQELVETFISVTGKKAVYSSAFTSEELLQHFPEFTNNNDLVREFSGMVEFAVEYGYFKPNRDLEWSRRINPNSLNWEQFLIKTGWTGEKRAY
ncbi:NmrA/HSCARG family protein [Mucilaginibacter sabulilitoris]|uniref:NmrA/HSCARG family protein n=1 Tax=Mucilaginibacter sabulilitoris TaxID=1173583 RepID=A0ABZ0TGQ4_9SPHI|nr:NmrA/HSCARG family protein [Mucilaginibacter sabulilitoris]WPU91746.1 NmrA/HSCARG family protein [Mucilaginibacter sabulilitoris]